MSAEEHRPLLGEAQQHQEEQQTGAMAGDSRESVTMPGLMGKNLFTDAHALVAELALAVFAATVYVILARHPAGLFTYHPAFQLVAIVAFFQGILVLQPTKTPQTKKVGLQVHQLFQYLGVLAIAAGSFFIIYNKAIHGARHITTWHAVFGVITLVLIAIQIIAGAALAYPALQSAVGGEGRAKSMWKYHRMSGYLSLAGLVITPLLALDSDWLGMNSTSTQRMAIGSSLVVAVAATLWRVNVNKLGIARR